MKYFAGINFWDSSVFRNLVQTCFRKSRKITNIYHIKYTSSDHFNSCFATVRLLPSITYRFNSMRTWKKNCIQNLKGRLQWIVSYKAYSLMINTIKQRKRKFKKKTRNETKTFKGSLEEYKTSQEESVCDLIIAVPICNNSDYSNL